MASLGLSLKVLVLVTLMKFLPSAQSFFEPDDVIKDLMKVIVDSQVRMVVLKTMPILFISLFGLIYYIFSRYSNQIKQVFGIIRRVSILAISMAILLDFLTRRNSGILLKSWTAIHLLLCGSTRYCWRAADSQMDLFLAGIIQ